MKHKSKKTCLAIVGIALVVGSICLASQANTDHLWSRRMTYSIMENNTSFWSIDFHTRPVWSYTYGLVFKAMWEVWAENGDPNIMNYIEDYYNTLIDDQGKIGTYDINKYNIDMINPGKVLIDLYKKTGKEKYKIAIDTLRQQMRGQPRTSEGGFWHKKRYPHQMWLDGIYMGSPFLAQYAADFNEPALFDDVANQIILIEKHTRDPKTGLLYHAWDESREQRWADPNTGHSPHFWGRAMGWYSMALVDVLDYLPRDHPRRQEIIAIMNRLFTALAKYQDEKTGVWYQVVDQGTREGNYLEATSSCMYVYAVAKAVRLGYADKSLLKVAHKGYQGILDQFITVADNGEVKLNRCCAVAGLGGNPYRDGSFAYYVGEPIRANDPKGTGPFILASLEMEKLKD